MRVLVACEFSNIVRDAFIKRGHDAYSCDLQRADHPNPNFKRHIRRDVRPLLRKRWDLVIAHPPCTYLCNSGVHHLKDNPQRYTAMLAGCKFFVDCLLANSPQVAVENSVQHGHASKMLPKYDQIIQPYQFGHMESKATCLWLIGLPPLVGTHNVYEDMMKLPISIRQRCWYASGVDRARERSRTFQGVADAMAEQWG